MVMDVGIQATEIGLEAKKTTNMEDGFTAINRTVPKPYNDFGV